MLFGTDENEEGMSVGTRCIRYYFCNALEMNSCLRDNLSRPTGHLSSTQESLNCDPIAVAKERGQNVSTFQCCLGPLLLLLSLLTVLVCFILFVSRIHSYQKKNHPKKSSNNKKRCMDDC
jgi:hypothetical protein